LWQPGTAWRSPLLPRLARCWVAGCLDGEWTRSALQICSLVVRTLGLLRAGLNC
jgi:hypothetical protein